MFDIAPTELMLVAVVALVVIGPKDLPKAMRFVGHWVGKARGVMHQFRSGFDAMVREAELQEMEKKWAAENERIMREHADTTQMLPGATTTETAAEDGPPIMAEAPIITDPAPVAPSPAAEPQLALEPEAPVAAPKVAKPRKPRAKKVAPGSDDGVTS